MSKSEHELEEYQDITILLKGQEWSHFVVFLKKQARGFQNQVNQHVLEGNIEGAKIAKALMDDRLKMVSGFTKQHNKLRDGFNGG